MEGLDAGHINGEWRAGERVALLVLRLYSDTIGPLDPLLDDIDTGPPGDVPLAAQVSRLSFADLARASSRAIARLAERDNRLNGRPGLRRHDWRVILYSLSGARTLREAIGRCAECFEAIDWRCGRMTLSARADLAELALDSLRPPGATATGCLIDLFGLAQIHALLGWLIGRPIPMIHVSLDHDESVYRTLEMPDLPFDLRFATGWTGFTFNAALLDYPVLRTADELAARPPGNLLFGGYGLEDAANAANVAEQVRRIALRSLGDRQRMPAFDDIAVTMGTSAPTLRRRLAREGTNYRQIRESCRREVALGLLSRTVLSIEAVATRLDYCDSDAFRQAFREWTGMSPIGYRKAMRAAG